MNLDQKKCKILEASKRFSKRQLDPKGRGKYIKRLEEGKSITESKVNEIYNRVSKLESEQKYERRTKQKTEQKNKNTKQKHEQSIEARMKKLEKRMTVLEREIRHKPGTKPKPKIQKELGLYGFTIKKTTTKSEGKTYQVYKAFRSIKGTGLHIYIGQDITKAKEKIIAYLKKNRKRLSHILPVILEEYSDILI